MLRKLAILFLTSAMMAQTAPTATAKKPAAKKPSTTPAKPGVPGPVTDDTPVLWITGLCSIPATAAVPASPVAPKPGAPAEAKCMRQITKKQFETMSKVFPPGTDKMEVAEVYAQALAIENHSRALNVENDQEARDVLWLARIKKLADLMHEHYQKEFAVSDSDIQAYYDQHKADFDEVTVEGVIVPKPPQKAAAVTTPGKDEKAPESPSASKAAAAPEQPYAEKVAAVKAAAEKMIERAKAGEDLAKLQKEAFTTAGIQEAPPEIEPFTIRHSQLRPQQEATGKKIFALEPGQYTELIEEPNAFTFYKLVSKRTLSAADVKNEIKQKLTAQKEQAAIDEMLSKSKPVLNPAYFPAAKPGAKPEGAAPQAAPEQQPEQPQAAPEQPKAEQPQQAPPKQEQSNEPPK